MKIVLLLSSLLPVCLSHGYDPFSWLFRRHWQEQHYGSLQADTTGGPCPEECDCPPSYPVAMYCDGRGLTAIPFIPSRIKFLYLQNNAITSVPESAFANATDLVWLLMHYNQLTSEGIDEKVACVDDPEEQLSRWQADGWQTVILVLLLHMLSSFNAISHPTRFLHRVWI